MQSGGPSSSGPLATATAADPVDRGALDAQLIAAHRAGDLARLVDLYDRAAGLFDAAGNVDAACFFLTQAYVFSLQCDDPRSSEIHARLMERGREE